MSVLEDIEQAAVSVAERVGPSVVRIGRGWGRGAGVVVADGTVVTNAHNLRGEETTVTFADDSLHGRVDALARGESPHRAHLGVALAPARAARHMRRAVGLPERDGLLVRGVQEDSPAARAGLRTGDLLVVAAGQPLTSTD